MTHGRASLAASDSTPLTYQYWIPDTPTEAAVAFLHGVGGHSGQPTYRYFVDYLVDTSCSVYGLDLRGFGRSAGRRGHVDRWNDFIDDVSAFVNTVRHEQPNSPLFLFGQSLGGLIALEYAMGNDSRLDGVIVSAPALAQPDVPAWLPSLVRGLARVVPTLPVNPRVDVSAFTRDPAEVARLKADPLRYPKVTARFAVEFDAAVTRVQASAHRFGVPLLVVVGSADAITPPQASQAFYESAATNDKTLNIYEGGYHQPILDTNREEVLTDIGTWIAAHHA